MYEGDLQSVLRCELCNKPFDKASTLKRHGYHCRSRKVGIVTRSRSCISCATAKARCDHKRPGCSRCTFEGIECRYPATTRKDTGLRVQQNDAVLTEHRNTVPSLATDSDSLSDRREASNSNDVALDTALPIPEPGLESTVGDYLDWNDPEIDFAEFWSPQTNTETIRYLSSDPLISVKRPNPPTRQSVALEQAISSSTMSIPAVPTSNLRAFIQRPKPNPGTQRVGYLMLHTLKSYPVMMLRNNTLPPFIHPGSISSDAESDHMEPLNNCISLLHMISSGVQGSRKLFWRNVRVECERLREEYLTLNKRELLAGMQALFIYILIRLEEGETDHNNLDSLMVVTVIVLAKQFAQSDIEYSTSSALYGYSLEESWKDWVFQESRRRLCIVYQVINMLVYFEPAAMCDLHTDLILAPLPAKKQLWEAGNEFVWKIESEKDPALRTDFGLAADGELVRLHESQLDCHDPALLYNSLDANVPPRNTASWKEWCSGMDEFGGLVMLAASLVG